jgi:hypothetical protein
MDELDRRAGSERAIGGNLEQAGALDSQKRPQAFSSREDRISHRLLHPRIDPVRVCEQCLQDAFDAIGRNGPSVGERRLTWRRIGEGFRGKRGRPWPLKATFCHFSLLFATGPQSELRRDGDALTGQRAKAVGKIAAFCGSFVLGERKKETVVPVKLWVSFSFQIHPFMRFRHEVNDMGIPLLQKIHVGAYVLKQHALGHKRYPLVLMLEPLFRCNLACAGCGKIDYPDDILNQRLDTDECLAAVDECGAPVVSIAGGEPLLHRDIAEVARGIIQRRKFVYLCTNAILMEKKIDQFAPSHYFVWSIHLDGDRDMHDR